MVTCFFIRNKPVNVVIVTRSRNAILCGSGDLTHPQTDGILTDFRKRSDGIFCYADFRNNKGENS